MSDDTAATSDSDLAEEQRAATAPTVQAAAAPASSEVGPGTRIDRYTVLERLGAGGMGEVFAAFDAKLERKIALKLLRQQHPEYDARLRREAQAMARLLHPNVVAVFDSGVVGGRLYVAMEFVRGMTLRKWQKEEPRSLRELLRVYIEAGRGLSAAHAAGLVHRDFKPDNVLLADDGRVKVTDFGIARAIGEQGAPAEPRRFEGEGGSLPPASAETPPPTTGTHSSAGSLDNPLTEEGTLLGTPGYMAPEQLLCEAVDARTDQFAFCVSLYEALYGVRPFGRGKLEQIARATLMGKIAEPPKGAAVPAYVRRVLLRGLRTERNDRYPSMQALLDELMADPARRRRRFLVVTTALALAAATTSAFAAKAARQRAQVRAACAESASALSAQWGPAEREGVRQAMLADATSLKRERTESTLAALDEFAGAWKEQESANCAAARVAGTLSERVYERRAACLFDGRAAFGAAVDLLREHDASLHADARDLLGRALFPPPLCLSHDGERSHAPLPQSEGKRAPIVEARNLTARARVLNLAGRWRDAASLGERAATLAREADAPSDEAAAWIVVAASASGSLDPNTAMLRAHEAYRQAEAAGDDPAAAEAARAVASELGEHLGRTDDAEAWLGLASAKLRRLENEELLALRVERTRGALHAAKGNFAAASASAQKAEALARSSFGGRSLERCDALSDFAAYLLGDHDAKAAPAADEALACREQAVGAFSASSAIDHVRKGEALFAQLRVPEALEAWRQAADLRRDRGATDAVRMAALASTARAEAETSAWQDADADARRVLQAVDGRQPGGTAPDATMRAAYARALLAMGMARAAAKDLRGAKSACARAVAELDALSLLGDARIVDDDPLVCLGEAELAEGDLAGARAHLERSVGLTRRARAGDLARARFALTRALADSPNANVARARELAALARDDLEAAAGDHPTLATRLAEVERWLGEHGGTK